MASSKLDAARARADAARVIPAVVHVIWLQGEHVMPRFEYHVLSRTRACAHRHGWGVRVWSHEDVEAELEGDRRLLAVWGALTDLHQRVAMARAVIAYFRGGLVLSASSELVGDPSALATTSTKPRTLFSVLPLTPMQSRALSLGACHQLISHAAVLTTPRRPQWYAYACGLRPHVADATRRAVPLEAFATFFGHESDALRLALSSGVIYFSVFWEPMAANGDATLLPSSVLEPLPWGAAALPDLDAERGAVVVHWRKLSSCGGDLAALLLSDRGPYVVLASVLVPNLVLWCVLFCVCAVVVRKLVQR